MKKEDFKGLLKSVEEAGQILRGEVEPSRKYQIKVSTNENVEGFALCVKTDDTDLLIPSKIYHARFSSNDLVGVVDEAGEAAIYPADFFIKLEVPSEIEQALENLQSEFA